MTRAMIFHHPLPLYAEGRSGSQVRPNRMRQAFERLGYQVLVVAGYARERQKAIKRVKDLVRTGVEFDFVYSESSTTPTLLNEPHHVPTHPLLDFGFFAWFGKRSVPIGLFYRDVYWRFRPYREQVPWFKRAVSIPMYYYDWKQYLRLVDHLFLPSLRMRDSLPSDWPDHRVSALPPGCTDMAPTSEETCQPSSEVLRLLYVGGILPPIYDIRPLMQIASAVGASLTVCCPADQWEESRQHYASAYNNQIRVVHVHGGRLEEYYAEADLFAVIRSPHSYVDFMMPVKVFEALGHGLPIVTLAGTEVARFVDEEGIGWVAANLGELQALLHYLKRHPDRISGKKQQVGEVRKQHTWLSRAQLAADTLRQVRVTKGAGSPTNGRIPRPAVRSE